MLYFLSHYQLVIRNAECIFLSVLIFFLSKGLGFAQFCNSFKTSQLEKQSPSFECTHRPICFFPLKSQMLVNHQIVQYQPVIKSKKNVFPLKNSMNSPLKCLLHFSSSITTNFIRYIQEQNSYVFSVRNYSGCIHTVHAIENV